MSAWQIGFLAGRSGMIGRMDSAYYTNNLQVSDDFWDGWEEGILFALDL